MSVLNKTYRTGEVLKILKNVSAREIQYWDEMRVVTPKRPNHPKMREYTRADLIALAIAKDLRKRGLRLCNIRRALKSIRTETDTGNIPPYILVGPHAVSFPRSTEAVLNYFGLATTDGSILVLGGPIRARLNGAK
jgi:DNA-binding transcriptional MerR regulator